MHFKFTGKMIKVLKKIIYTIFMKFKFEKKQRLNQKSN